MSLDPKQSAFPLYVPGVTNTPGIDVRTYIATKALVTFAGAPYIMQPHQAVEMAVIYADALIAELNK